MTKPPSTLEGFFTPSTLEATPPSTLKRFPAQHPDALFHAEHPGPLFTLSTLEAEPPSTVKAKAPISEGESVSPILAGRGEARPQHTPHGVLLRLEVRHATPGVHAIHLHEGGKCDASSFESFRAGQPVDIAPFLTGVLSSDGSQTLLGPVGIAVARDGALLVGDESGGVIYRIDYHSR